MKLVYFTSMRYPSDNGMKIYARELAKGFTKVLKKDFVFVVANDSSKELQEINNLDLHLRLKRFRSPFFFFCIPYFVFLFRKEKDLVFFTNDTFLLTYFIFWKKLLRLNYRICSDWHHLLHNRREKFILRNSDMMVTTSHGLKKDLIKFGNISNNKLCPVYGGVNMDLYIDARKVSRAMLGLPDNKIIIGYIGFFKTFGLDKGISTMIKALAFLPETCMMAFVGGKEAEIQEYSELAQSLGVQNRCFFFGIKRGDEIAQYQMAMDIVTIPYPDQPGFGYPMKVYEYMASRHPIIYSRLGLVEEVLSDCAYSFTPNEAKDFAEAVKGITDDKKKAEENVLRAYEKVKNYTWDNKARCISDFLRI